MVCSGFEPGTTAWQAQTNPLSWYDTYQVVFQNEARVGHGNRLAYSEFKSQHRTLAV